MTIDQPAPEPEKIQEDDSSLLEESVGTSLTMEPEEMLRLSREMQAGSNSGESHLNQVEIVSGSGFVKMTEIFGSQDGQESMDASTVAERDQLFKSAVGAIMKDMEKLRRAA